MGSSGHIELGPKLIKLLLRNTPHLIKCIQTCILLTKVFELDRRLPVIGGIHLNQHVAGTHIIANFLQNTTNPNRLGTADVRLLKRLNISCKSYNLFYFFELYCCGFNQRLAFLLLLSFSSTAASCHNSEASQKY